MGFQFLSLNINHTFNLCGLIDLLRTENPELVFLQETSHTSEELSNLVGHLGYSGYTSMQDQGQPGVGVIYKDTVTILEFHVWQPGRLLFVRLENISFVNIYAPSGANKKHERNIMFSETLFRNLSVKSLLPVIVGDFNCILSAKDTTANFESKVSKPLEDLVKTLNLSDAFRKLHPDSEEYTYYQRGHAPSRLDRAYIPCHLVENLELALHKATTSDHRALVVELNIDFDHIIPERHSAYWKLNTSILQNKDFMPNFNRIWLDLLEKEQDYPSTEDWWEKACKPTFKSFCIKFSTMLARGRKGLKAFLYEALNEATLAQDFDEIKEIRARLQKIINEDALGHIIRSKDNVSDEEERASIYHLNREWKRSQKTSVSKLNVGGNIVDDSAQIETEIVNFFTNLFQGYHRSEPGSLQPKDTGQPFVPDLNLLPEFLDHVGRLEDGVADHLEQPLTFDELKEALKSCSNSKSPGLDGLPYEFYSKVVNLVGPKLVEVFNNQLNKGLMLPSFRKGVTKLLPKVLSVPCTTELRPITLLVCDYKLMSKILANRLTPLLDDVLVSNQLCGRPDTTILFGATDFLSSIDFINQKQLNGFLMGFDIFKAYDKANVQVILKVMEKMNFGPKFMSWIDILHKDISTQFILSEGLSATVQLLVSVKQGDPLAMALFLLNFEPLLARMKAEISGLRIGRCQQKNAGYVDDTSAVSTDERDIGRVAYLFDRFEQVSGTVLNKGKCKITGLGGWRGRQDWPVDWLQPVESQKIFGIHFFPTVDETIRASWEECSDKFRRCLMSWKGKPLHNLSQRTIVLKTFATSKLWYLAQVLPMPKTVLSTLERMIGAFLWRGHLERLALPELYLDRSQGGLGLPNIAAKADALFLMHLVRILKVDCPTRDHLMYWIGLSVRNLMPDLVPVLKSQFMTPYFKHAVKLITDSSLSVPVTTANLALFKTRLIYGDFNSTPPPPKVEAKFDLEWERVWTHLNSPVMSGDARNVMFLVIHNIYPNKERLHRMNLHPSGLCPACGGGEIQNNLHLFAECASVRQVFLYLKSKLVFNQIIPNLNCDNFKILMLGEKVDEKFSDFYCFMVSNYVLYVHKCLRNDKSPKVNDLKQFLINSCPKSLEISF